MKIFLIIALQTYLAFSQPTLYLSIQIENQQFLIVDSRGQKVGFDIVSKMRYKEIPYLVYSDEGLGIDDEETGKISDYKPLWMVTLRNSSFDSLFNETYTIILQGEKLNSYSGRIYSLNNNKESVFLFQGIIDSFQTQSYKLSYSTLVQDTIIVRKLVNALSLSQSISSYLKMTLITNRGIANSLQQKIENAGKQKEKGQTKAAINLLQAFINEVKALQGKGITKDATVLLIADAEQLIKEWGAQ